MSLGRPSSLAPLFLATAHRHHRRRLLLRLHEVVEDPLPCHQLLVGTDLHHLPVVEDDEPVVEGADDGPVFGHAVNVENLTYTGDGDFIGIGNSADNVISSGGGEDVLFGLAGDDVLYGGGGDDALFGGEGNDLLVGGYGDDRLEGGSGDDVLFLGRNSCPGQESYGRDTIVLKPGFGSDIVIGFDPYDCSDGHDRLDVSAYESLSADSIGSDIQITACGPHTIITINEDSITLLDVNASTIGKEDFIFS